MRNIRRTSLIVAVAALLALGHAAEAAPPPAAKALANTTTFRATVAEGVGKTILAGTTQACDEIDRCADGSLVAIRLKQNGSPAKRFGNKNGLAKVPLDGPVVYVPAVAQAADGGLIFAAVEADDSTRSVLIKLTSRGVLDTGFGINGRVEAPANFDAADLAVDSEGRILLAGDVGTTRATLARYLPDGEPDDSFGTAGVATVPADPSVVSHPGALAIAAGDEPRLAGTIEFGASYDLFVAGLEEDGTPDSSFGTGGVTVLDQPGGTPAGIGVAALEIDGTGRLLVAASQSFDPAGGSCLQSRISRLSANGLPDTSFGTDGNFLASLTSSAGCISFSDGVLDPQGRMLLSASSNSYRGNSRAALVRINGQGALDNGFGTAGIATAKFTNGRSTRTTSVALAEKGRVLVAGSTTAKRCRKAPRWPAEPCQAGVAANFKRSGVLDRSFGPKSDGLFALPTILRAKK